MKNRNQETSPLKGVILFLAVIAILFLFKAKHNELDTARAALTGLIQSNSSVQGLLNWEKLKAVGVDVGAVYRGFKTDKDRDNYKKYFIRGFSAGFKEVKGNYQEFGSWRVYEKTVQKTVVAADYRGKILLFTLPKNEKKIIEIQWKE
mgnify:FL=1